MDRLHHLALAAGMLVLFGCPEESAPSAESAEREGEAAPTDPAPEQAPATDEDEAGGAPSEEQGEEAELVVKESLFENNLPSGEALRVELHPEGPKEVAVWLEALDAECGPVPEFVARVADAELRLFQRFEQDDPECIGTHSMKLRIHTPMASAIRRVRVLDPGGEQIGAAEMSEPE